MRSDRRRARPRTLLLGAVAALWLGAAACQLGDGDCLRMSDCDRGYTCVEGTCLSNEPLDERDADADADARTPARADASRDAAGDGAASDGGDASGPTDAATGS